MNDTRTMLLIGVGTAGCAMARGVRRAFGGDLACVLADTDAASGAEGEDFVLLGGDRLSGRGAGGNVVEARMATEDSVKLLDPALEGVRLVVIVTALGGGTGGGATLEICQYLSRRGLPTAVFATTPFAFEGEDRARAARGVQSMIVDQAGATFFLPLDLLVAGEDAMDAALRRAVDTLASGVTLFWRLVARPGYLRADAERLRHLMARAGRGRFATVTVQGPNRAAEAVDLLARAPVLAVGDGPVRAIFCGVLAGEDLRLSEVGRIAEGVRDSFGRDATFDLATVNDEETFSGRLSVVTMLFERAPAPSGQPAAGAEPAEPAPAPGGRRRKPRATRGPLAQGPTGRGRFNNAEPTIWNGEDLDVPTFIRRGVTLDV